MAFWQSFDFLFCSTCGALLSSDSVRCATCPFCGFKCKARGPLSFSSSDFLRFLYLKKYLVSGSSIDSEASFCFRRH
jgi:hypothetical protein